MNAQNPLSSAAALGAGADFSPNLSPKLSSNVPLGANPWPALQRPRRVERLVAGQATSDGDGVKLTRVLTQNLQRRLDPFLMLDAFGSDQAGDYIGGFPDHPHRGFETVTYMLEGRMRHRDSAGNVGLLVPGSVQWMTAGRGVIHSEMPEQEAGLMEGFQLWLNLPARDKLCAPWYRDIATQEIPELRGPGYTVRVIAGSAVHADAAAPVSGAVRREATAVTYLDVHLDAGTAFAQPLVAAHNAFIYVYRGEVRLGETQVGAQRMAILANDAPGTAPGAAPENASDGVALVAGPEGARLLLIAGQPLNEPIAQYGPFVMNTNAEIHQAVEDFRAGRLA